jgi:hypothetical protein
VVHPVFRRIQQQFRIKWKEYYRDEDDESEYAYISHVSSIPSTNYGSSNLPGTKRIYFFFMANSENSFKIKD